MNNHRGCLHLRALLLLGLLTSCPSATPQPTPVSPVETEISPAFTGPAADVSFPIAQPLSEDAVRNLEDEQARQVLLLDREYVSQRRIPPSSSRFVGPRLVSRSPAELTLDWVDQTILPAGQVLEGYLDMAAVAEGEDEHDFLITLLVDYQQVAFELGDNLAPAHVVRLPAWEPRAFPFRLPGPLSAGRHELLFLVHDDPYNAYAIRGVTAKHHQGGRITFDAAAGYPFHRPVANRHFVIAGKGREAGWVKASETLEVEPFEPRKSDLLNVPLLISLTGDETDPLIQEEPALVAGSKRELYAFVYYGDFIPSAEFQMVTAALVAILDGRQVRLNGQETLLFQVQAGQRYRIPLQIEWPPDATDGRVHALYFGIAFGIGEEWGDQLEESVKHFNQAFFASPVMVVPERQLIEYIWDDGSK